MTVFNKYYLKNKHTILIEYMKLHVIIPYSLFISQHFTNLPCISVVLISNVGRFAFKLWQSIGLEVCGK